jgi:chemotaxis regulatin CheY-phosphate phosphatase CheZ
LSNDYHHGLAQDVQDHVVRIYEACNFQDLAGQRIGKVITTLIMVEERLIAMIARYSGTGNQPAEATKPSSEPSSTVPGSMAQPATPASATSTRCLPNSAGGSR